MDHVVVVYQAASIIERDALVSELAQHGILAVGEVRDMSRKMTNNTVDLALGGYSSVARGFPISTAAENAKEARKIIYAFLAKVNMSQAKSGKNPLIGIDAGHKPAQHMHLGGYSSTGEHMRKFYASAMYSLMLPGAFHVIGAGHFFKAILNGESINKAYFVMALLVYAASGILVFYFLAGMMGK